MKKYYPSNGTEGMIFTDNNCNNCYKMNNCSILINSFAGKQPKQWIYNEENKPFCTSFNSERPKYKRIYKPKNNLKLSL
jgi:hypothetical protein